MPIRVRWWSVAVAGVVGSLLRWAVDGSVDAEWPVEVLIVNVCGSALLGWFLGRGGTGDEARNGDVAVGFCGGLTTMSAFTVGFAELVRGDDLSGAAVYLAATLTLGVGAARLFFAVGARTP